MAPHILSGSSWWKRFRSGRPLRESREQRRERRFGQSLPDGADNAERWLAMDTEHQERRHGWWEAGLEAHEVTAPGSHHDPDAKPHDDEDDDLNPEHNHDLAHDVPHDDTHTHTHTFDHAHTHDPAAACGEGSGEAAVACAELPSEAAFLAAEGLQANGVTVVPDTPLVDLSQTFLLNSNPGASKTIYLDFNGHTTTGTYWNDATMGASFTSPAYDTDGNPAAFSATELTLIQRAWQRVAADFATLDVNVTTQAPPDDWLIKSSSSDPNYGVRVVISSYGPSSSTAGGIAYINSFNWNTDTPAFVYNKSLLGVSEAISHEVGHTLGLSHDGTSSTSYYEGHGSGETGWAPIMGVGYYKSVTTWDNGVYYGSNNSSSSANYNRGPDDLAIITSVNGFGYLADQVGNSQAAATGLTIQNGSVSQFGSIETAADQDWYSFTVQDQGSISLDFDPYWYKAYIDGDGLWGGGDLTPWYARVSDASTSTAWADNGANLDLSVELRDASGNLIGSSNPTGLAANLSISNLAAGTYFLRLDGTGFGDPSSSTPSGYLDYGSIGNYLISGSINGAVTLTDPPPNPPPTPQLPVVSLSVNPVSVLENSGTALRFSFNRSGDTSAPLTVLYSLSGTATNGSDYSGSGLVSGSAQSITFAAGSASATLDLLPTADTNVETDEIVILRLLADPNYTLGTSGDVVATILNDDLPRVTLSLSPTAVAEDGSSNLVYTVTRSTATSDPLSVNLTLGGTAILGSDYSGISASSSSVQVTIAANATSTQIILDPTADTAVESNETVSLALAAGSGYTVGTTSTLTGTITNDDLNAPATAAADILIFTPGLDNLNGLGGGDTFQLLELKNSLLGSSTTNIDKVTGLESGLDVFDSPLRSTAILARQAGSVSQLSSSRISRLLTSSSFEAYGAATFTFGSGTSQRQFLVINDGIAGYQQATDALIELVSPTGSLANLVVT